VLIEVVVLLELPPLPEVVALLLLPVAPLDVVGPLVVYAGVGALSEQATT
jgi:hypothetical protein